MQDALTQSSSDDPYQGHDADSLRPYLERQGAGQSIPADADAALRACSPEQLDQIRATGDDPTERWDLHQLRSGL